MSVFIQNEPALLSWFCIFVANFQFYKNLYIQVENMFAKSYFGFNKMNKAVENIRWKEGEMQAEYLSWIL